MQDFGVEKSIIISEFLNASKLFFSTLISLILLPYFMSVKLLILKILFFAICFITIRPIRPNAPEIEILITFIYFFSLSFILFFKYASNSKTGSCHSFIFFCLKSNILLYHTLRVSLMPHLQSLL